MIKPKIGLDFDDVTAPFNAVAVELANEKYHLNPPLSVDEITTWDPVGRVEVIKEFWRDPKLYKRQVKEASKQTIKCIRKLMEVADVYFITACFPEFMSTRAAQIQKLFPDLPRDRIILGSAKNLVNFDVLLDDNIDNVLDSPADYAVLMRQPWNKGMTGVLSVNNMEDFVSLVHHIIEVSTNKHKKIKSPSILAIVGPTGAGKNALIDKVCSLAPDKFEMPLTYTTKKESGRKYVSEKEFKQIDLIEQTVYGGYLYGTTAKNIEDVLNKNKHAIIALDMCGAISMKTKYPTVILHVDKKKESLILDILNTKEFNDEEKMLRILSLDAEKNNKNICDYSIDNNSNEGYKKVVELVK